MRFFFSVLLVFYSCLCHLDLYAKTDDEVLKAVQALVVNLIASYENGDRERIVSNLAGVEKWHIQNIDLSLELESEMQRFKQAFVASYGDDAWLAFQDIDDSDAGFRMNLKGEVGSGFDPARLSVSSDRMTYQFEWSMRPAVIRQSDGMYLFEADSIYGMKQESAFLRTTQSRIIEIIRDYSIAIGVGGVSPGDIDYEMSRAMAEKVLGLNIPEDKVMMKFDIEKIIAEKAAERVGR